MTSVTGLNNHLARGVSLHGEAGRSLEGAPGARRPESRSSTDVFQPTLPTTPWLAWPTTAGCARWIGKTDTRVGRSSGAPGSTRPLTRTSSKRQYRSRRAGRAGRAVSEASGEASPSRE